MRLSSTHFKNISIKHNGIFAARYGDGGVDVTGVPKNVLVEGADMTGRNGCRLVCGLTYLVSLGAPLFRTFSLSKVSDGAILRTIWQRKATY